jgi:hypothetical protein
MLQIIASNSRKSVNHNQPEVTLNVCTLRALRNAYLIAGLGIAMCAFNTSAQISYSDTGGSLTITGYTGNLPELIIPESIAGKPVSKIAANAFSGNSIISTISIPNSVTNIGSSAFEYCIKLQEIRVASGNEFYSSVAGALFDKTQTILLQFPCAKGDGINMPDSVRTIEAKAFQACSLLTNIYIPDSVTRIGENAFGNCEHLRAVRLPGFITELNDSTFANCTSLTDLAIPNSVKTIGNNVFIYAGLQSIDLPDSVEKIGNVAFASCTNLSTVRIGLNVRSIGTYAFFACSALKYVYFAGDAPILGTDTFRAIGQAAFFRPPNAAGWGSTFAGYPISVWVPTLVTNDPVFGVKANQFGFTVTGSEGLTVILEGSVTLENPKWVPIATNVVSGGSTYLKDPASPASPSHFYRLRSP